MNDLEITKLASKLTSIVATKEDIKRLEKRLVCVEEKIDRKEDLGISALKDDFKRLEKKFEIQFDNLSNKLDLIIFKLMRIQGGKSSVIKI